MIRYNGAVGLGRSLRRWRALRQVKQAHAAELLGVDQSTISRWESGRQRMSPAERARVETIMSARLTSAAERALARLIECNPGSVHLICDVTHKLLALSSARAREFARASPEMLGASLLPFATEEILQAEQGLAAMGWYDLAAPPEIELDTGENHSDAIPIWRSRCRWTRMTLSDGAAVRLVETLV